MNENPPPLLQPSWSFVLTLIAVEAMFAAIVLAGVWAIWNARSAPDVPEIRALLKEQAAAWNRGDLDGFMAGYWKDDRLVFASGPDITTGWQATHDRYHKRYKQDGKSMGNLTFSGIAVTPVDDGLATARGTWHLDFSNGQPAEGRFALVLKRFDDGWRVVYDHTTSHTP